MGIVMGLDGAAMSIAMGLDGMGINGAAMDEAVGLDLSMAIVLAGVRGQTRGITTGLLTYSRRTDEARQNGLTFIGILTT